MNPSWEEKWHKSIRSLHEIGAVQFGEFKLTSGKISPYYIDLRIVPSHPKLFDELTDLCTALIRREVPGPIDKMAGVPLSGLSFATLVSFKLGVPLIFVRKEQKEHGRMRRVEGDLKAGDKVLLVDDLATTGKSILEVADAVRGEGGLLEHAVVVLDREEGAERTLSKAGIQLHSCLKLTEVMGYLRGSSLLNEEQYSSIMEYRKKEQHVSF